VRDLTLTLCLYDEPQATFDDGGKEIVKVYDSPGYKFSALQSLPQNIIMLYTNMSISVKS